MPTFSERLLDRGQTIDSDLCIGLDPRLEALPEQLKSAVDPQDLEAVAAAFTEFCSQVIEACAPYALAFKPQVAFFEAFGAPGYRSFLEVCRHARSVGVPVIADVKRGDIGSTAEAYARAYLAPVGSHFPVADAVTVNAYLGTDGVLPFLREAVDNDGALFVLVRTSNPSSEQFQTRVSEGKSLAESMAEAVVNWNLPRSAGYGPVGAVIGATHPEELQRLREQMPGVWILIPGFGAQGGAAADVVPGFDESGRGALVNASRSVTFPWLLKKEPAPKAWLAAIERAAAESRDAIRAAKPK